jgi:hypothetical protein
MSNTKFNADELTLLAAGHEWQVTKIHPSLQNVDFEHSDQIEFDGEEANGKPYYILADVTAEVVKYADNEFEFLIYVSCGKEQHTAVDEEVSTIEEVVALFVKYAKVADIPCDEVSWK